MLAWLRDNDFWRNVSILAGSTAVGQVISVLATPIITRLYSPDDFGLVAVYTSILGVAGALVTFSYQIAILTPEDDRDAANLLVLCLVITASISAVSAFVVYIAGVSVAAVLSEPRLSEFLWLLPVSILLAGLYGTFNYWTIRKKLFTHIAQTKLTQSGSGIIAKIGMGLLELRPLGLFVGTILNQSAGSLSLARLAWKADRRLLSSVSLAGMGEVARKYIRFPIMTTPTALINAAGTNVPTILLTTLFGAQVTGWFSLGQRLVLIPITLVGTAIGQVYLGEMASLAHSAPEKLFELFSKTVRRLAIIAVLPATIFLIGGGQLIQLVFGQEWYETGVYLQILSISFIATFVATPVSQVFSVFERQDLALVWNIVRLSLISVIFYIVVWQELTARTAVSMFAAVMFLVDLLRLFLVARVIKYKSRSV